MTTVPPRAARPRRPVLLSGLLAAAALAPTAAQAQAGEGPAVAPGAWDVTSRITELSIPGVPGFIQRMIRGRSRAEHKRLAAGDGVAALLAPDPKARCRVDEQRIAEGRYQQMLSCPQKKGGAMQIARQGSYGVAGFAGTATVTGTTPRGPLRIVLDQRAARTGA